MSYYDNIAQVNNEWDWPTEKIKIIESNSLTNPEGKIRLRYDDIDQVNSTAISILLTSPYFVPATQYTTTGINLYTGPELTLQTAILGLQSDLVELSWQFQSTILGVADGEYYFVSITVNSKAKVDFVIKIANPEV